MSVLLNITMPNTCEVCPCNDDNWRCGATGEYFDYDDMYERRRDNCPLVEIPTPHGRLIDADKIEYEKLYIDDVGKSYEMVGKDDIDGMSAVIEAEG